MIYVNFIVTVPKFKFKDTSILCLVFDWKEYSVRESDNEIFAGDGAYQLAFCRWIWLSDTEVYNCTWRRLLKANDYIVVDACIDWEHNLMIADIILPVKDPCVDSIRLREDLSCEFDRAAGRASWTGEVF